MKRLFLALGLLMVWTATAVAQQNCVDLQEIDGSPRAPCVRKILVTNGTLTCATTNSCTLTTGGGGGGGSPGGSSGQVQWNDGGSFNGTSGLTATATTVTIVSGVTATFSRAGLLYTGTVTTDNASVQTMLLQGDRATPTGNDEAYITYRLSNAAGTQTEVARQTWAIPTATAASEDGRIDWSVMTGGALAKELQLSGADLAPSTNDGLALGTASNQFSDLFLASGAVIDFANGNAVLTHSSGILTVSTGDLRVTTAGTNAASVATLDGTQALANKTITAATNTLGSVTMDVTGTDADGDTYYRASNVLSRLAIGAPSTCLKVNVGGTAPEWGACGGSSGIEVGVTAITSGTGGRLVYETAGNLFGEISGATSDGAAVTFTGGNLLATSPVFTTDITTPIVKSAAGDALAMNATAPAAANGASQVGENITITASPAVASLDTAGAAAGGSVTITSGAAARLTSGDANGGDIILTGGAGIGTGRRGVVRVTDGSSSLQAVLTIGANPSIGFSQIGGNWFYYEGSSIGVYFTGTKVNIGSTSTFGWSNGTNSTTSTDTAWTRAAAATIRASNGSTGAGNLILGTSAGAIGTSGAGVLAFTLSTTPSTSPTDTVQFYSADSAAADHNVFSRNEAGEVNRVTGLAARNSAQVDKTNDTLATATGLTRNVEAGRTYAFRANLQTTSDVAAGVKFAVSGTATATAISYEGVLLEGTAISAKTRATALDTAICAVTAVTAATCQIEGVIQVNAAGTLLIQFAQNATNAAASSVLVNQYFQLIPIS